MKTDWGTAVVGLVATIAFIAPFVVMYRKRVKREKRMYNSLKTNAKQQNTSIGEHEFCGDFAIGINDTQEQIFFFKNKKGEEINQFVNLSEIQKCELIKKGREIKSSSMHSTHSVSILFYTLDKKKPHTEFELFHEETNLQLSGELQLGEKWCNKINSLLKTKK